MRQFYRAKYRSQQVAGEVELRYHFTKGVYELIYRMNDCAIHRGPFRAGESSCEGKMKATIAALVEDDVLVGGDAIFRCASFTRACELPSRFVLYNLARSESSGQSASLVSRVRSKVLAFWGK